MNIWVDADACPKAIKEVILKFSQRLQIKTYFVANKQINLPMSPYLSSIRVAQGADVADNYIVEHCEKGDLVITADIPLAALVVEEDVLAINPRGELYTEENVGERLSIRDFMKELRDSGVDTGGPPVFNKKDVEQFTNTFNKILSRR